MISWRLARRASYKKGGNQGKEQQGIMLISHGKSKETVNRETGNRAWLLLL
jgi:hypothetical protein